MKDERIRLRNYETDDVPEFVELVTNPKIRMLSASPVPEDEEILTMFGLRLMDDEIFAVEHLEDDKVIGEVCVTDADVDELPKGVSEEEALELGIDILPEYWRKGYGTETYEKVFEKNPGKIFIAKTFSHNEGSIAFHQALGFKEYHRVTYDANLPFIRKDVELILMCRDDR